MLKLKHIVGALRIQAMVERSKEYERYRPDRYRRKADMTPIETVQALVDALGDLSFECCGGICGTTAPTVATYNRTFDVLVKARALLAQMQAGNGLADEPTPNGKDSAPVEQVVEPLTSAARDVLAERQRQISAEGWTPEHDDEHAGGSMAFAAAAYAVHADVGPRMSGPLWNWTGWSRDWWKPKDKRRDLVRAGALILAEIERLDRKENT